MLNNQKQAPMLIEDLGLQYPNKTSKQKKRYGLYKCLCGNEFRTQTSTVVKGLSSSCGCHRKELAYINGTTHGKSKTRIYQTWVNMKQRCNNIKSKDFYEYGGRGVTICDEWRNDFKAFYDWAMANGYAANLEIDRRDNNGNYEPLNCRFVNEATQARHKRILSKNNTSGYRGVGFNKKFNKWKVGIRINNKHTLI